jgi:hypothetical protein
MVTSHRVNPSLRPQDRVRWWRVLQAFRARLRDALGRTMPPHTFATARNLFNGLSICSERTIFIKLHAVAPRTPDAAAAGWLSGHPCTDGDFLFGMASDISLNIGEPRLTPVVAAVGHGLLDNMDAVARYAQRRPGDTSAVGMADIGSTLNTLRFHDLRSPWRLSIARPTGAASRPTTSAASLIFLKWSNPRSRDSRPNGFGQ